MAVLETMIQQIFAQGARYAVPLIGCLLLAIQENLLYGRTTQRETFRFMTRGFIVLSVRYFLLLILPALGQRFSGLHLTAIEFQLLDFGLVALSVGFFLVAVAFNLGILIAPVFFVVSWVVLLTAAGFLANQVWGLNWLLMSVPDIYLATIFFILALSFWRVGRAQQRNTFKDIGAGFLILSGSYVLMTLDMIRNDSIVIPLAYASVLFLSLLSQVRALNLTCAILERQARLERKKYEDMWEISPFPILITRLRDDSILYMNPLARRMFGLTETETHRLQWSEYFADPTKRDDLIRMIHQNTVVSTFPVQLKSPGTLGVSWADLSARAIDWGEDVALYITFKDITAEKVKEQKLLVQAATDPLTGLFNRRQFEMVATQGLHLAARHQMPFAVMMADIDFFKKVNDTYGHAAGDVVLKVVAQTIKSTARKSDVVARFGGEEFIVLLQQADREKALRAGERVRAAIAQLRIPVGDVEIGVTVSVGLSATQTTDLHQVVAEADKAPYHSKK
ncbi:MAG: sensor domain-containing diguanylate cyclase, partial [Alphaproteobacteria bacterium]|nr:sensor domain-containing diguanylate cyclase [Alphaproteobacteria bacterium]